MQKMLGKLVIIVVLLGVLGLYRGWFSVSKEPEGGGDTSVQVNVNKEQVEDDANAVVDEAKQIGEEVEQKIEEEIHGGAGS